uniref:Cadherin domain-containing protein n=1 Tax=Dromaius novaehollandiae TaxID=8790 RepID=A0A8C4K998_DRONO
HLPAWGPCTYGAGGGCASVSPNERGSRGWLHVLTVRATDGDAGANADLLYRLLNAGGPNEVFEIDPRSGVIRTRGPVDREAVEAYELLVEAADQGQEPGPRSATATVRIAVEDDNDNAPQFSEKRYVARVPEDVAPNSAVLRVTATDRDKGSNALVHYSIVSGNSRGHFYIDAQTGALDVVSPLDYEDTAQRPPGLCHRPRLGAQWPGLLHLPRRR